MKLFENKLVVGGICILIAGILAFFVLPTIYKNKASTVVIYKLKNDISAGVKIEKDMLREIEVGSFGMPDNVIKSVDSIVGKYTKSSLLSDDLLFPSKFSDYIMDERMDQLTKEGKKLMSVSVGSIAAAVSGYLKSGDIISILCYSDNNVQSFDELKNIEIYSIENEEMVNVEVADEQASKMAATLTLVVTDIQAHKLTHAEYSGKLHAVLESRGNTQ